GNLLRSLVGDNPKQWDLVLPQAEFAYNRPSHGSIGKSPFFVVYGRSPFTPLDLTPCPTTAHFNAEGESRAKQIQDLHMQVREQIVKHNLQYQQRANHHRKRAVFNEGDLVWIHLHKERFPRGRFGKLQPRGDEPFKVIKRINDNAYKIELPKHYNVSATFNVGDLTRYVPPDDDDVDVVDSRSSPFLDGEDDADPSLATNTVGFLHSEPFDILGVNPIPPKGSLRCHLGNGSTIRFLKDIWFGDEPLCSRYNRLFCLDINENCSISDRFKDGSWYWQWSRPIVPAGTRLHIDHHILPTLATSTTWTPCLPRKVNIFFWRFKLDRLPHRLNLSKHGIEIESILCPICNKYMESADHTFFSCEVSAQIWCKVRNWCNISDSYTPSFTDWSSWLDNIAGSQVKKKRLFVIVVTMFWFVWKYRNDVTFNSHQCRKSDIYDLVHLYSFNWLKFRGG
ncbi:RNA-directed DNA polymerase, partial [Tanacetum coccineum]